MEVSFSVTEFTRIYLALFFSGVAVFYISRILFVTNKRSQQVIFPGKRYCLTWWNHTAFRIFRALIWMVCLLRWIFPDIDQYLGLISTFQHSGTVALGLLLLTSGFTMVLVTHFSLGSEWRSGIDPKGPLKLKTDGFYRYTRNPTFLFVAIAQVGFFLSIPSAFTALCLCVGLYTLYLQTIEEEKHLLEVFQNDYRQYMNHVPRWI